MIGWLIVPTALLLGIIAAAGWWWRSLLAEDQDGDPLAERRPGTDEQWTDLLRVMRSARARHRPGREVRGA